jgi:hypothetical protein
MKIPAFVKQLAKVCDSESSRYALGGIKCESDGTTAQLTATDGRILANVYYPDEDEATLDVIVEGKSLAAPPAAAFKDSRGVSLNGTTLRHGGTLAELVPIEGRFPRFEDIFAIHDEPTGYVPVKLDPTYLKTLCELAHGVGGEASKGIVLWVKDAQSCVFGDARSGEGHVARLAIMPLAADDPNWTLAFPPRPGAESAKTASEPSPGQTVASAFASHGTASDDEVQHEQAAAAFAVPDLA